VRAYIHACMHTYARIHVCAYPVEHQKIIIIIVVLYLSPLWQEVNPHVPVFLKNYPLSNLVNVIRKNLLAEFACLLLLLN
jgi:hypothetical protein